MDNYRTIKIKDSASLTEAKNVFMHHLKDWIYQCINELEDEPPLDGHDQATFTTSWGVYISKARDNTALRFMTDLRDNIKRHFDSNGSWKHGYWTVHEAHHGTEHFELFLGELWRIQPDDEKTVAQMIDAAEHMGNWVLDIPEWFDWDTGIFNSIYFGTCKVDKKGLKSINIPDHFRCINICLLAYEMTKEKRYLELASVYCKRWAFPIVCEDRIPVAIDEDGPIYEFDKETSEIYRGFVGQLPRILNIKDKVENILASGGIDAFLKLWKTTGEELFLKAAQKLIDIAVLDIIDPDAGTVADMVRKYLRSTGDTRYNKYVFKALNALSPYSFNRISIVPYCTRIVKPSGFGKRKDMPEWYEDDRLRRHNPLLLSLAAEINEDEKLLTRALDIACACFNLSREVFSHGREHGCSARSVSAVARGHGRDNNAGVVTSVLKSAVEITG